MYRAAIVVGMLIPAGPVMAQGKGLWLPGQIMPIRPPPEGHKAAIPLAEMEVRSQLFDLVDSKGRDRASLVADDAGSVFLVMFDAAGKTRANLSVGNEGPSLVFYD